MTTQYAVFSGLPTGLTLTKKVFTVADPDTEVTGITGAITERTNAKGQYVVAVTKAAVISGIHTIILFVGSTPVAIGKRTFAGTDGETASELGVELDTDALDPVLTAVADVQDSVDANTGFLTALLERVTTGAAALFVNLAAMITGSGAGSKFTATALEDSPAGEASGGLTEEQDTRLITIASQTAQITGSRLQLVGPVTAGGEISLVVGSDYVEDLESSLIRTVTDAGGVLHGKLTSGELTDLVFSAAPSAKSKSPAKIKGEVAAVAHAGGITIITIEIDRANIPAGPYGDDWKYQIWRTADSLVTPPLLEGSLVLHWRT